MSGNMRSRPSAEPGKNSRMSDENTENRNRYEGFEGMNYEQIRQPYNSGSKDRKRNQAENQGNSNRRDE